MYFYKIGFNFAFYGHIKKTITVVLLIFNNDHGVEKSKELPFKQLTVFLIIKWATDNNVSQDIDVHDFTIPNKKSVIAVPTISSYHT